MNALLAVSLILLVIPLAACIDLARTPSSAFDGRDLSKRSWLWLIIGTLIFGLVSVVLSIVYFAIGRPRERGSTQARTVVFTALGVWLALAVLIVLVA
jgi:hypothetical protein